jgi:hypothetical protein
VSARLLPIAEPDAAPAPVEAVAEPEKVKEPA